MRAIKYILTLVAIVCFTDVVAQDIHYSQFYNAPLTVNPALTGRIAGSFRIGINYRNQWPYSVNGATSFSTPAISFDMPIRFNSKNNILGVGAYIVNDRSASGLLTNLTAMASVAFHKGLGANGNHAISIGVQGGYIQRQVDQSGLIFGSKIQEVGLQNLDPSSQLFKELTETSINNVDLAAGFMWNSRLGKKINIYAGASVFHILQPEHSFSGGTGESASLPRRYGVNAGLDWKVGNKVSLLPSFIYMRQTTAQQFNFGLSTAIDFNSKTTLFLGAYYRLQDAVIPYVGLDFSRFRLGVSYDANASDLTSTNGAFEVSLSYMGKYVEVPSANPSLYCPRF